ncbi:MAG: acyl-CoA dehydrogenase family protein, partial [Ilumatobacter sp.]
MTVTDPASDADNAISDHATPTVRTDELIPLLGAAVPAPRLAPGEHAVLVRLDAAIDEVVAPLAVEHDAAGRYPTRAIHALKQAGLLALAVPTEFGGVGAGHAASLEAQVRLAAADSAVAQVFKVHDELVREIFVYCPDELRAPLATRIVDDHHVLGLAVAESGKRVDTPWTTTVVPHDADGAGGWVIDGTKIYTTGAAEADEVAVWAFDPTAPGIADDPLLGFRLTLVERGARGMVVHRDWDALGQRATDSGTITFDGVIAPLAAQASIPGRAPLLQNSLRYQAGFAAVLVGIGLGAIRSALPFVADSSRPWPSAGVESATDDPMVRRLCG